MSAAHESKKPYHHECTGFAIETAKKHQEPQDITLFTSWLSAYGQRVWTSLEYLEIPYKYYEIDPFEKSQELLELSPKGLVPALKLNGYSPTRALNESTVILEYLEEIAATTTGRSLLPPSTNPYARALVRLQCDQVNRTLLPAFYRYLRAQDPSVQAKEGQEFHDALHELMRLLERTEREVLGDASGLEEEQVLRSGLGLWVEGGELNMTDVMVGPWLYRANIVLKHYRGIVFPSDDKLNAWLERLFNHPAFKATCSADRMYIEGYKRQASPP